MLLSLCTTNPYRSPLARRGVFFLLVALVLLAPMVVRGQDGSVETLIERASTTDANVDLMETVARRAKTAGLSTAETADLLEPAVRLAETNLPSSPFLNKTLEGLAKKVPPSRMKPVLQQLQSHTQQSGRVVSGWLEQEQTQKLFGSDGAGTASDREELIVNVTEAQQQKVSLKAVTQFLETLPAAVDRSSVSLSQVSVAVSVLPDLPSNTNNPKVTRELLTAALNAGYDGESLRQLPAALERAQRETQRPPAFVARGVAQAIARGTPAASVLRNLFQGSLPGGGTPSRVENGPPGTIPGQGKPPGKGGTPPGIDPPDNPGQGDGPPGDNPGGGNR